MADMKKRKAYVATIQVLVLADNDAEAIDGISGMFEQEIHNQWPFIQDWGYLKVGGQYMYPTEYKGGCPIDISEYEEGDFLV